MSKTQKSATAGTGADIKRLNIIGHRKIYYIISLVLIAVAIVVTFIGADVAIEFKGGTMITYSFSGDINDAEAEKKVEEITGANVTVQQGEMFQSDRKKLSISFVSNEGFTAEKQAELTSSLQETYNENDLQILDSTEVAS